MNSRTASKSAGSVMHQSDGWPLQQRTSATEGEARRLAEPERQKRYRFDESTRHPAIPATTDARRIPTFAASKSGESPKARLPTNRDIVNPIPARHDTPRIERQVAPAGSSATPDLTATQLNSITPNGFPISSPATTPSATRFARRPAAPSSTTPAFAKAKSGMMA